jgi:hypothetical protein
MGVNKEYYQPPYLPLRVRYRTKPATNPRQKMSCHDILRQKSAATTFKSFKNSEMSWHDICAS